MEWIDLKSGVALAGSLVVLAGSIESRLKRGRDENPENPTEPDRPKSPDRPKEPEERSSPVISTMTERDVALNKPFQFKGPGGGPKASA